MKTHLYGILFAVSTVFGASADVRAENTVYACTGANGSVALTNTPNGGHCETLYSYTPPAATAPAAPAAATVRVAPAAPAGADADGGVRTSADAGTSARADDADATPAAPDAQSDPAQRRAALDTRLAQRRDAAIQETRDAYANGASGPALNRAVTRRYLMTNRADYQRVNGVNP